MIHQNIEQQANTGWPLQARWHVAEAVPNHMDEAVKAAQSIVREAYCPMMPITRKMGRRLQDMDVPRFAPYFFVRFGRFDDWPALRHHRNFISRILCTNHVDANGFTWSSPTPVPDEAIEAIRSYTFDPPKADLPIVYQPGQKVTWTMSGTSRDAVFVGYVGNRTMVRTWIFGAERICEVRVSDLELDDAA